MDTRTNYALVGGRVEATDCTPCVVRNTRRGRDLARLDDAALTRASSDHAFDLIAGAKSAHSADRGAGTLKRFRQRPGSVYFDPSDAAQRVRLLLNRNGRISV